MKKLKAIFYILKAKRFQLKTSTFTDKIGVGEWVILKHVTNVKSINEYKHFTE